MQQHNKTLRQMEVHKHESSSTIHTLHYKTSQRKQADQANSELEE
jgi:hypothetical protein